MTREVDPGPGQLGRLVLWVVAPLLVGVLVAFVAVPVPQVGVVRLEDYIWYGSVGYLTRMLDYVRTTPNIRAVVLQIDSPGGAVIYTEELYFHLLKLRESKPLVVSIEGMAASGGYYIAAAGDYILAKPASIVGNIGVISTLPSDEDLRFADENYVATGPFKFSGGSRDDFVRKIELLKLGFLEAVFTQRGDRITVGREVISSGEIFLGMQARRYGLIDELGATSEAIQKAAQMAHLAHYRVVDVAKTLFPPSEKEEGVVPLGAARRPAIQDLPRGLYYLYVEPEQRRP